MLRAICALVLAAAVDASAGIAHPNLALRGGGKAFPKLPDSITPGVLYGDQVKDLIQHAKDNCYAIPAVNCVSSGSINSVLEAAAKYKSPVMIQFSNGGSQYYAGKSVESPKDTLKGCVLGAIAGALHTKQMAEHYGVPVILHSDHCAKKLLPWFDGMLEADEKHFKEHGTPLFSSHMLDLSEEPHEENIATCAEYLKRMAKINCLLEMEIGITGGEEDGVNNEDAKPEDLYSKPEEVMQVVEAFSKVPNAMYTIAAAFGNVHGVYKAGNVKLSPEILGAAQAHVKEKTGCKEDKPVFFVFHGGSGSEKDKIKEALNHGVVKMNIDTDIQWATWDGIRKFEAEKHDYLQGQIGNPEGPEKPNKKHYDPRTWLRKGEEAAVIRLGECMEDLNCKDVLA
jgi:fructose-bisphosphate aldolase class II